MMTSFFYCSKYCTIESLQEFTIMKQSQFARALASGYSSQILFRILKML